jgi:hypothetical protein
MEILKTIGLIVALGITFTPPQSAKEFLHNLVGQRLILRHYTGSSNPEGNRKDLSPARRECDVAVEVTAIAVDKSSIRVQVRNIGTPNVVNKSGTIEGCANVDVISFQINGFDMDQPRDQAEKKIGYVLQTPETYLAALGIPWSVTSSSENESPVGARA